MPAAIASLAHGLRKLRDVIAGILARGEVAAARQRYRIIEWLPTVVHPARQYLDSSLDRVGKRRVFPHFSPAGSTAMV
jgi:hypothetical protein